ncbi:MULTISPECIES: mobile element transfer protein [unclassified Streptomyces]|uniref:mobile element transfer protein n=1 Tax=unclassified Streptomyces TaxID=2593676 RepID=UPI0022519B6F|nr:MULTISPECIES: mobile element transfer protein [unclassified Streptomyces]MCX5147219.1 Mobile element transfer [Streptomyces sp. NBC_00320]
MRPNRFYKVIRFGPVRVGSYSDGRGRTLHTAVCTAPGCDFSADYRSRAAAELAAQTHRCNPR